MATPTEPALKISFSDFYRSHFLPEHRHPVNVGLHVAGTLVSAAFVPFVLATASPLYLLLYPLVHAVPGLVGHRLFERNAVIGDVRVLRKDFSPLWFIAANHVLSFEVSRQALGGRARRP